jgi:hypothetical protein
MPYNVLTREPGGACAIKRHERPPHSKLQMNYAITKEIRIHHEDGWFYQFTDDSEGCIEVEYYETSGITETKQGNSLHIPKDCIPQFIQILEELK